MVENKKPNNSLKDTLAAMVDASRLSTLDRLGNDSFANALRNAQQLNLIPLLNNKFLTQIKELSLYNAPELALSTMKLSSLASPALGASSGMTALKELAEAYSKKNKSIGFGLLLGDQQKLRGYGGLSTSADWLERHKNTFLFDYLTSYSSKTIQALDQIQADFELGISSVDIEALRDVSDVQPELEKEIVEVIKRGGSLSELSKEAQRYLSIFWVFFWDSLQKVLNTIALITIITASQSTTEGASTSKEVRAAVKSFPTEHRELLAGYSAVTSDHVIIRAKPDKNSAELGRVKIGTWVENLGGDTDAWTHVTVDIGGEDVEGWISRRYLLEF